MKKTEETKTTMLDTRLTISDISGTKLPKQPSKISTILKNIIDIMKKFIVTTIKFIIIALAVFILMFLVRITLFVTFPTYTSENLIKNVDDTSPAFLGVSFSDNLKEAITNKEINLYGIYICYADNSKEVYFQESEDAVPGTASRLKLIDVQYVEYCEEEFGTFSKEFAEQLRNEGRDGYWNYTIDIV